MKLKDIADMKEYLENRCYCPYEIYDLTGFFFNCFEPDVECELLAEGERGGIHGSFVLAKPCRYVFLSFLENKPIMPSPPHSVPAQPFRWHRPA